VLTNLVPESKHIEHLTLPCQARGVTRPQTRDIVSFGSKLRLIFPLFAIAYIDFHHAHTLAPDDYGVRANIDGPMDYVATSILDADERDLYTPVQ